MKTLIIAVISAGIASAAIAGGHKQAPGQRDSNWGEATKGAIEDGFDQGAHASDPSGDGQGPGTSDEPRSGLANVVGQGDLSATMDALGL